jgi:signal transduction histidine kinase
MSHELRTPLNAIIGFSELMNREIHGPIGNDAYREYVSDIHRSGSLLLAIVNSILDLSRIDSGKHDLRIASLCLKEVWQSVASILSTTVAKKGIALTLPDPMPACRFSADANALSQILLNLVSNAVKFTQVGGRIDIGLEDIDDGQIALSVRDNGRGIPPDRLADVMKPFVQVSEPYARDTGGVGLGLAICKSLADAMSSHISLDSQLGQGTTARVILPRASCH